VGHSARTHYPVVIVEIGIVSEKTRSITILVMIKKCSLRITSGHLVGQHPLRMMKALYIVMTNLMAYIIKIAPPTLINTQSLLSKALKSYSSESPLRTSHHLKRTRSVLFRLQLSSGADLMDARQ
jgi:hypothetical protein